MWPAVRGAPRRLLLIAAPTFVLAIGAAALSSRRGLPPAPIQVRVSFSPGIEPDAAVRSLIEESVVVQRSFPALARDVLAHSTVRVVLAPQGSAEIQGAAMPDQRALVLPYPNVREWSREHLHTVLRHELAHIALATASHNRWLPTWFDEGYAALVSGELSCEDDVLLEVAVATLDAGAATFQLDESGRARRSSATYSAYANAVKFADSIANGGLAGVIKEIPERGFLSALEDASGLPMERFETLWQDQLFTADEDQLDSQVSGCASRDEVTSEVDPVAM